MLWSILILSSYWVKEVAIAIAHHQSGVDFRTGARAKNTLKRRNPTTVRYPLARACSLIYSQSCLFSELSTAGHYWRHGVPIHAYLTSIYARCRCTQAQTHARTLGAIRNKINGVRVANWHDYKSGLMVITAG